MVVPASMIVDDTASPPPRKRLRQEESTKPAAKTSREPRLFVPFRALGLITNHIPFVLQTRSHKGATDGPRIHLLTCLGKSWALWEGGKMGLLFVGPDAPEYISCMAMDGDAVWVASGPYAIKYIRGKEVSRVTNPLGTHLSFITVFGSQLLALTENGDRMLIWSTSDEELESMVSFDPTFSATFILHPATYLNKVVVASSQGGMQLWNTRTNTCIHQFSAARLLSSPDLVASGSTDRGNAITALVQSPAIDVVGIGYTSGEISVYDIRADERLMRMYMEGGGVKALGFRTDGHPVLASASSAGHIALWDLNEGGRLLHMVRGAHDAAITALEWVPGQPVLITSSEDNSVKQWLFDSPTSPPRLLKYRSGHQTPPHLIRYYADDGKQLLTASRDRSLRCTSVVRDSRSFELSQGSLLKKATSLSIPLASLKFPPITSLSYSSTRSKDWDDIITAHADETFARTWTMQGKRLGKYSLGFVDDPKAKGKERGVVGAAKAVCVTACGNFGLAGSSTGQIQMWNLQSGIKRKSYALGPCPAEVAARFYSGAAKSSERTVTGLATDSLNRSVIASTLDGTVNFFDFQTTQLEYTLVLPSTAVSILLQRDSGLLAVICDDMTVRIIDIETRRIVRELSGFHGRILDIASPLSLLTSRRTFSPDSRWLVASSLDAVIRTFDVPTGRLIDAFRTASVATSISFSPTNDFLATAHVDSVGVFLWANRAQYAEVSFQSISDNEIFDVALPSVQGVAEDEALEALTALKMADAPQDVFSTPPQLDGELITLTLLPRARWQTLLNLEVIQQRNKPKEPPKAPEHAPFFLPTLPGVEARFAAPTDAAKAQEQEKKKEKKSTRRIDQLMASGNESVFYQKLAAEDTHGDYETFFSYAKHLSPAALDLELRTLPSSSSIHPLAALALLLHALAQRLRAHRDFEAVQAMQAVVLRAHGDVLIATAAEAEAGAGAGVGQMEADAETAPERAVLDKLRELEEVQRVESKRVLELIASSLGTLGFVRDTL
ncbi:U3 small nucleolar RNA-associated protein 21-like protein [Psilocybe cubensis]|uniref:Small-subunit processome Utp21 domain-containing protein n=2 Tax=Psilocybe cubensis TaxID=181762 RepID=A0A8H8CNE0_PSICU|nr:U3 small nucleolar RNA-associated protein 21-like protein [Psilocybe cubensis]KAH9484417.1 U3 small nucleolar RNA-associated protein 21-like protein [Psilocybe cubensis]